MIDVRVESVSEEVNSCTIHGWHTSRLLKYDGSLYFCANKVRPEGDTTGDWKLDRGLIFRREPGGPWQEIIEIEPRVYTSCVDSMGRFWTTSSTAFNYCTLWRSRARMDLSTLDRMYDGSCAYLAAGVSAEDNFLLLHSENTCHTPRFPNAVIAIYYDAETDSWRPSRMETPEGRYGYMGIVLRGRSAIALLQSTIFEPAVAPELFGYSWRLLRLARCDDLTKGEWVQQPWLMRKFGQTRLNDMIVAPDGGVYVAYHHRGGDESYEATERLPKEYYIARIGEDLSVETFSPGIRPESSRLFVDSKGQWYVVGRLDEKLQLWRLDPVDDFKPTKHWELPGTDNLKAMLHTLRPERFGGEDDGDTVHLVTSDHRRIPTDDTVDRFGLWHASFRLPVDE